MSNGLKVEMLCEKCRARALVEVSEVGFLLPEGWGLTLYSVRLGEHPPVRSLASGVLCPAHPSEALEAVRRFGPPPVRERGPGR